MNCRKTEESPKSFFARYLGIFKIAVSRVLLPIIVCRLKLQLIINNFNENKEKWSYKWDTYGCFEFGGGKRSIDGEISTYFSLYENRQYFSDIMKGRDKLVTKLDDFKRMINNSCISMSDIITICE